MKYFFRKSILIIIIFSLSALIFSGYRYTITKVKTYLCRFSEERFNAKLTIGHIGVKFPLYLELKDLKLGESINIRAVQIYLHPISFLLNKNLIISTVNIVEPEVKITRNMSGGGKIPGALEKAINITLSRTPGTGFYFSKLHIQNGSIIINNGPKTSYNFVNIRGIFESPVFYLTKSDIFVFKFKGLLKNRNSDSLSPVEIRGNVELGKVINAELRIEQIELDTLGHLYVKYMKDILEEGRLDLNSNFRVSKNNLKAKCNLTVGDVVLKPNKAPDKKIDSPIDLSFILLVNFKDKVVKVRQIQGTLLKLISGQLKK